MSDMPSLVVAFFVVLIGYPLLRLGVLVLARPLHRKMARLAKELASDPAYADDADSITSIKALLTVAYMDRIDRIAVAISVLFPVLLGALIWSSLREKLYPESREPLSEPTAIEDDSRFKRLFELTLITNALGSPAALVWLAIQVAVLAVVLAPIAALVWLVRRHLPFAAETSMILRHTKHIARQGF